MEVLVVKRFGVAALLVGIVLALGFSPPVRDEISWHLSQHGSRPMDYAQYLQRWPSGRHAAEARQRLQESSWREVVGIGTSQALTNFLQRYPGSSHTAQANQMLEALMWKEALAKRTSAPYAAYLAHFPRGTHVDEAKARLDELRWLEPRVNKLSAQDLLAVAKAYQRVLRAGARLQSLVGKPIVGGVAYAGAPLSGMFSRYLVLTTMLNVMGDFALDTAPKMVWEHANLQSELEKKGVLAAWRERVAASEALEKSKANAKRVSGLAIDRPEAILRYCQSRGMM